MYAYMYQSKTPGYIRNIFMTKAIFKYLMESFHSKLKLSLKYFVCLISKLFSEAFWVQTTIVNEIDWVTCCHGKELSGFVAF